MVFYIFHTTIRRETMSAGTIMDHFLDLPDPRTHVLKNRHIFMDIIVIAVCAVICGADDGVAI